MQSGINLVNVPETHSFPFRISWQWLAVLGFVLMEISSIVPWILTVNASIAASGQLVVLLTCSGIVLLNIIVVRLGDALMLRTSVRRLIIGALLVVDQYLGLTFLITDINAGSFSLFSTQETSSFAEFLNMIPAWFIGMILVIALWWRGLRLANERIGPIKVFNHFRIGIVLLGLFAVSGFLIPLARAVDPTGMLFSFLFFGLLSLVASRVSILGYLRGGSYDPFDRRWLLAIILSALGFVLLAYGIAALTTGQAAIFFGALGGLFILIGMILAAPLLLFLYLITPALSNLRESLPTPVATQTGMEMPEIGELSGNGSSNFMSWTQAITLSQEARILLALLGIVAVAAILIWSFRWISGRNKNQDESQQNEYLLENQDILKYLRKLLQHRLQDGVGSLSSLNRLNQAERARAAERVRVIYADLLELAMAHGYARPESATPLEFKCDLGMAFPGSQAEIGQITQAYLNVRYGELPETGSEVAALEHAWQHIQSEAGSVRLSKTK